MDDSELWVIVDRRRQAIVDLLSDLSPADWKQPSLCDGWTVRDVVAHLTMPLLGMRELLTMAIRYPGSTNRLIRDGSISLARRHSTDELQSRMQRLIGHHKPFPGLTVREALVDATGHTLDIVIPLGREVTLPPAEVVPAADQVVSYAGGRKAKVFRSLPIAGLRLVATDHPWSTGSGPEIHGTMTDLFLLLTGRTARVDALRGPGAEQIRQYVA